MCVDRSRLAYVATTSLIAGLTITLIWRWRNKQRQQRPPTKWRQVGVLEDIVIFPVKSMGPVRIDDRIECTELGLKYGWLRDRSLMVVNQAGKFVTARQWPMLIKVSEYLPVKIAIYFYCVFTEMGILNGNNFQ